MDECKPLIFEGQLYKETLANLLRFETSKEGAATKGAQTSLDQYVARMPDTQEDIYYLVANGGRKQAEASPYLEAGAYTRSLISST